MMEELLEVKKQLKEEEAKTARLEHELTQYQLPGAIGYYYELNRWQNAINEYMKGKSVTSFINGEGKEFERMMALMKHARENVETISELEKLFEITGVEEDDKAKKVAFIDRLAVKKTV